MASVTVKELNVGVPEGAKIVASTLLAIGIVPWLYQVVVKFGAPDPVPAVSDSDGAGMWILAVTGALVSWPSLVTTVAVSSATCGPPAVLSYPVRSNRRPTLAG